MSGTHIRVRLHTPTFTITSSYSCNVCDGFLKNLETLGAYVSKVKPMYMYFSALQGFLLTFQAGHTLVKTFLCSYSAPESLKKKKKHRMHVIQKLKQVANIRQFFYAPTALLNALKKKKHRMHALPKLNKGIYFSCISVFLWILFACDNLYMLLQRS